jgi:O-antigen/teichoic acid export membrane protein
LSLLKGLFEKASCFLKRPFIRNVAIVASGTAAAQLIAVAFSPLITRIFGPEAFGLLGVFKALVATLAPIAALTYPIAIVLPKKDSEAIELMKLSFSIALIVFVIVAIAFWVGGYPLLKLLDSEMIAPYVMLIPLSI